MPAPALVAGAPCWIDLMSSDTDGAAGFYGRVFGWKAEEPQEGFGGYFTFTKDGKHVGGCMENDNAGSVPDLWTVYLLTADVDATAAGAAEHGGTVELAPIVVGENGSMAMLTDPGQATFGVWQPNRVKGFEVLDEVGTPGWFELHTGTYDAAVEFYEEVLGWDAHTTSDAPDSRYTTLGAPEHALAGIMDASRSIPEGLPGTWKVYFRVDGVDATLELIEELGGQVLDEAEDTPHGRIAEAADPSGAAFRLIAS